MQAKTDVDDVTNVIKRTCRRDPRGCAELHELKAIVKEALGRKVPACRIVEAATELFPHVRYLHTGGIDTGNGRREERVLAGFFIVGKKYALLDKVKRANPTGRTSKKRYWNYLEHSCDWSRYPRGDKFVWKNWLVLGHLARVAAISGRTLDNVREVVTKHRALAGDKNF